MVIKIVKIYWALNKLYFTYLSYLAIIVKVLSSLFYRWWKLNFNLDQSVIPGEPIEDQSYSYEASLSQFHK